MAACRGSSSKWFFTRDQLESTPSRRCGVEPDRELSYRQQAANLIQDMGQRLNVSQLTINTAIVYMHRFYMHHSFTKFHRNIISPTTLFLAAKVEEQPRKLEHVIKVAHACLNPQEPPLDTKSNAYLQQAQELVILESIVLQTLGFEITIDHPHTDVVKCTQLVRASKDLAQTSYFMATNSLHLTTFCLQHKPTVIACVCIHLACKWSNWEIPVSTDGKHWWEYVDNSVTLELLDELTHEFLQILEKTPSRLKRIRNWRATQAAKKPKSENAQLNDNSFDGPSVLQGDMCLPGSSSSNPSFSKLDTAFPVPLPGQSRGASLSMDTIINAYMPASHSEWPQSSQIQTGYHSVCVKEETVSVPVQDSALALQASGSSLLQHPPYGAEKMTELNFMKQEQKGPSPALKLSLDKYREKHAGESAAPHSHSAGSGTTASPMKMKGQERRHHGDKRDKNSVKLSTSMPGAGGGVQLEKSGQLNKDELKMKIKMSSSERHSSSDEGIASNNKNKHSSPLVSKEKHRGGDHNLLHRPHKLSHLHAHSGNGRGAVEGPAGPLRGPPVLISMEGTTHGHPTSNSLSSSSSRKRIYTDGSHNHHSSSSTSFSKVSKLSKGGAVAAGTSSPSSPLSSTCFSPVLLCVSSSLQLCS
uniref:Cyclin T2a n=1 Tax=Oryzias sinensis TaxID=183150 RepID=A0A8C7YM36_9TELE